jgi:hypothetical protein
MLTLSGRMVPADGTVKVLGYVLPDAAAKARRQSMCADAMTPNLARELDRTKAGLILVDDIDRLSGADRDAVATLIHQLGARALIVGAASLDALQDLVRPGDYTLHLDEPALVGNRGGIA